MMASMAQAVPEEPVELEPRKPNPLVNPENLPVVARIMIEIRSDGTRTMARGALDDVLNEQQTAIELPPMTPLELSAALSATISRTLLETPGAARAALRHLVPSPIRKLKHKLFGSSEQQ